MNPISTKKLIRASIIDNIYKFTPVADVCQGNEEAKAFGEKFQEMVDSYPYVSEPYIERIPFYRQKSAQTDAISTTLASMMKTTGTIGAQGERCIPCIEQETAELFAAYFGHATKKEDIHPESFRLYEHQVLATQAVDEGKNLIVSTGTGSGKTESFLIPVLNAIIAERKHCHETGKNYIPGVRAMILYPMNALVADQLRRIRDILRVAEQCRIPYAEEITFGMYTGEVETLQEEDNHRMRLHRENGAAYTALLESLNAIESETKTKGVQTEHPYLSNDSSISNEYTARSDWENNQAADILITNYSMLERLMLDPARNPIFSSETWKFIVLDEAHTYDGGTGTEIAWLMRRLAGRISTKERPLQYIATSATMFPKGEIEKAQEFGAELFPAEKDSFSVQEGMRQQAICETRELPTATFPLKEWKAESFRIDADALIAKVGHRELSRLRSQSTRMGNEENLYTLTLWYQQAQEWLSGMGYLHRFAQAHQDSTVCSLGDLLAVCRLLADFAPEERLTMSLKSNGAASLIQKFVKHLIDNDQEDYILSVIRNTQSIRQERDVTDAYDSLKNFSQEGAVVSLPVHYWISVVTMLYEKCNIFTLLAANANTIYAPLYWPVEPESMHLIQEIHTRLSEAEQALDKLGYLLVQAWQKALGNNAEILPDIVTSYLLQFKEFYLLEKALEEGGGHIKWELAERIFNGDEGAFDMFASLLTLSRHPELKSKPLMDLRFHQCVGGMSTVGVWFECSADGCAQAHLLPDEEKQHHEDADGNLHPVYTLSVCAKCGQPYLSGYVRGHFAQDNTDADQGKKLPFVRYSGRQRNEEQYCAFAWLKGNQAETMLAADPGNPESKYWLCYDTGVICKQSARPTEPCVPLYYAASHQNDQNDTAQTHIAVCPVCGGLDLSSQRGEYGIIAPFKTRETVTRNVALYAMCETADKQFSLSGTPQGGKKVLAFSDSRYKAAAVSVYFEAFMKTRVVEEGILKNISPIEEDCATLLDLKRLLKEPNLPDAAKIPIANEIARIENQPGAKVLRYPTLTEVAEKLRQHLAETGGLKQLRYIYEQNNRTHEFSELNGAVLAALTCLRKSARNSVLNRRLVAVRPRFISMQPDNIIWQNWCTLFPDEQTAETVFLDILAILYMKVELYCSHLPDDEVGPEREHYTQAQIPDAESEVAPSFYVNGCEPWDRPRVAMQAAQNALGIYPRARNKIIKLMKSKVLSSVDIQVACSQLMDLLRNGQENEKILVSDENHQYLLNINAICYSQTDRTETDTRPMSINTVYRAEEHTAQIELAKGKLYQSLFAEGKINVLSCSTTFEMGVDLGSLNSVFLCNMPPTVANYTQRAGRAGRRAGSASHVITFMGSRPHDQYYRKRPEELFFGTVRSPRLYLSNISYRAKHLRAEALHDFLQYCVEQQPIECSAHWNKSGTFFCGCMPRRIGNQNAYNLQTFPTIVENLEAWEMKRTKAVQEHCESIVGEELPYSVAADLCYQLTGQSHHGGKIVAELSRELAGPHVSGNPHATPLCDRYKDREDALKQHEGTRDKLIHLYSISTIDYLAQNRLLPIYGFPCDVIELEPHQNDRHSPRLSRDKRVGIYEYAPQKKVLADKRIYQSHKPVFYHQRGGDQILVTGSRDKMLYRCPVCLSFSESAGQICPVCGQNGSLVEMRFYSPDAFRASMSTAAIGVVYDDKGINCRSLYPDSDSLNEQEAYHLPDSNILLTAPAKKEIHFLNTDAPWQDPANETQYQGIFHTVQTDFLFLTVQTENEEIRSWSETRRRHAWESAAQALAKAAARELQIHERDLDAMTIRSRGGVIHIVLIDNTTNGSGILLPLLEVCEKKKNTTQTNLIRNIFRRAVSVCTESDCSCSGKEDKRIPLTHEEYLSLAETEKETHREYTACYLCLKGYNNQMLHGTLDAHDAAVILRAMMSEGESQDETEREVTMPNMGQGVTAPFLEPLPPPATPQPRDFTEEVMRGIINGTISSPARLLVKYRQREVKARYIGRNDQAQYIIKINNEQLYFLADELQQLIK